MNRAGKGSDRYVCLPPGGMRLSDMPGVKHSESVLKAGRGMRTVCYFNAADLKRLAGYLRLCRAQELARRKCAAQNS